jgi:outer membrane receptor for ferrienterochelin and colicins
MKYKTLLLFALIFNTLILYAQIPAPISGRITDDRGEAMIGVTVVVKGTTVGTVTDADGRFALTVPAEGKTIVFRFLGYDEREASVEEIARNPAYSIRLVSSEVGLNQVVVSASKKREKLLDAPASISVLSGDKLLNKVVTSPVDYLKSTPGVDVMQTGLISNNVVIRGFNNIFSGTVLNVVDDRIGSVPSLKLNAYQLVPTSNLDIERIEVLRGPASALYGPNASSGVIHIMTKSPLDQENKFETTVALNSGFTVQGTNTNTLDAHTNSSREHVNYSIVNPEFRTSGKLLDGKFGYKVSGAYFQGQDYTNYDPREPYTGDSLIFGSVKYGQTFQPDTLSKTRGKSPYTGVDTTFVKYDVRRFARDFNIHKWNADGRIDYKPTKDILLTLSGGVAQTSNIELTGLGAGQVHGWLYWYMQAKFKWKNLFFQYFVNVSDAMNTYLIPQLTPFSRQTTTYYSPYQVQRLVDKSKLHGLQLQHSWAPIKKLSLIYGADALITLPQSDGTIYGRFDGHDNVYQAGAYIQGDYDPLRWLKLVAAFRIDYNSIINNLSYSPRVAVVFKPKPGQNIRLTFNRAFDAPASLEQFLDLANGQVPNGINVRGIGNPYGYKYSYDPAGNVQFITAPYSGGPGTWVTVNNKVNNYQYFDSAVTLIANSLAKQSGTAPILVHALINALFNGISGPSGLIQTANQEIIDYAALAQSKKVVKFQPTDFKNLNRINNQTTQTLELGYKGLFFSKLQFSADLYWTHEENYVGALSSASGAVIFDLVNNPAIVSRLKANAAPLYSALSALDNKAPYTNPNLVKPDSGAVYDEVLVLLSQLPIGTVTPKDSKIGSDYILTYNNLGTLDLFGLDLGLQYQVTKDIAIGGSFSWVNKNEIQLSTGQIAPLNAPKYKSSMTFDHTISKIGIGYGLTWRWQDAYPGNSSVYIGTVSAANLFDARLTYRPKFYKKLLFAVNVNDIFNYHWQSFPGAAHVGTTLLWKAMITF